MKKPPCEERLSVGGLTVAFSLYCVLVPGVAAFLSNNTARLLCRL